MPNPWPKVLRIARDPLRISLMVLIIIAISRIHQNYPLIAAIRPALLATGLICVYAFLNPRLLVSGSIFRTWPARMIVGVFVLACLSVPAGISMGNSGKFILDVYIKTMVFAFLIIAATRNARDLYTFSWALLVSCGALAYLSLWVFDLVQYNGYARLDEMYMYDANDTGCVLTIGIGVALVHMRTSRMLGKIVAFAILIAILASIAKTGSRGALVGVVAAGVALLFLVRGTSFISRILVIGVAVAGLSLWAPPGYWDQMNTILHPKEDYNYTDVYGRKKVAERGMGYMRERPVLGVGIFNFNKAECQLSDMAKNYTGGFIRCTPPHNAYIQAGAELGMPGFALFIGLMLTPVVGPLIIRRQVPKRWKDGDAEERFLYFTTVYMPVGAAGFAVAAFFLSFAWMDITYVLPAMVAGLIVAVRAKLRMNVLLPPPPPKAKKPAQWRSSQFWTRGASPAPAELQTSEG